MTFLIHSIADDLCGINSMLEKIMVMELMSIRY